MAKRRPRPKGRQFLTANSLDVWVSPFPNIVIDCIYSSSDITAERAVFPQSPREQGQFRVGVGLALRIFAFHRLTSYFEHQKLCCGLRPGLDGGGARSIYAKRREHGRSGPWLQ